MNYICPVCGYPDLNEKPRGELTAGSYEICPSCGFQFGVSDEDLGFTFEQWRDEWVANGMTWKGRGISKPDNWNPKTQIEEFLNIK